MKNMMNSVHIEGQLYDADLKIKTTGPKSKNPGVEYINGEIGIATDKERTNILKVHYTYVVPTTAKGGTNVTFTNLKSIIDGTVQPYMKGNDNAPYVKVDTAIALNDFYTKDGLVSVKRNEGGFLHFIKEQELNENENLRNQFKVDIVITNVKHVEADEEKNTPEKAIVKGAAFGFRKDLLPIELTMFDPEGIAYLEDMNPSNKEPLFTQAWGEQVSKTVVKIREIENAFGSKKMVDESRTSYKDYVINGFIPNPYVWDDAGSITVEEFSKAISDRNTYLATVKKNYDDYSTAKKASPVAAKAPDTSSAEVKIKDDKDFDF